MRSLLRGQRCDERCYPSMPYKPYPTPSPHELAADGLLLKFRALPEMLSEYLVYLCSFCSFFLVLFFLLFFFIFFTEITGLAKAVFCATFAVGWCI